MECLILKRKENVTPLIKSGYARLLLELFREYEKDPFWLLEESGLPADLFDLDQEFLPHAPFKKLIYLVGNQLGITQFGELIRTAVRQRAIPRIIGKFSECKSLRDALEHTEHVYHYESTTVDVGLESNHGRSWYWCRRDYEQSQSFVWSEVWSVIYFIELIRTMTNTNWTPKQIKIQSDDHHLYKDIMGASTQYFVGHGRIELLIDEEILSHPIKISRTSSTPNPPLITWHSSFTDKVFTALLPYAKEQDITLEYAAELLKLSPRTLQRRLGEEKTNFRKIKNNIVFTVAVEMMEKDLPLTHIASQLGFANISHFSRSFKRMSGLTPQMYQKTILNFDK